MSVKFAIVGAGYIGKRHADMITSNREAVLCALADIKPVKELGLEKYNVPVYNGVDELLNSGTDFDVLSIATPNGLHATQAIQGLNAGKHVIIEKPMALNTADCAQIIETAEGVNKMVFCVMQNRYSPPAEWLKKVITEGVLGNIYMVQLNCFWNRDDRYYKAGGWKGTQAMDGGVLFAQFSHFVDMMYWLFGDISKIHASFADFAHSHSTEFEDSGMIQFEFNAGGMGCINYSTAVYDTNFESSITVIAENGSVKVGGQYMNEVSHCHIKNYKMPVLQASNPANNYGFYQGSAANHNFVFENVIESIKRGGKPTTNALEGMKVVEILENIYKQNPFFGLKRP